jgi:hypothetical protein
MTFDAFCNTAGSTANFSPGPSPRPTVLMENSYAGPIRCSHYGKNPVELLGPTGFELVAVVRELRKLRGLVRDRDALRLGSGVSAGNPDGQHARVVRRRDGLAGDVRRQLE